MGGCTTKIGVYEGLLIRIAFLGDAFSGKTSIISRFAYNKFSSAYLPNTKNLVAVKSFIVNTRPYPINIEAWEIHSDLSASIDLAVIVADISMPISELQDYYWKYLQVAKKYGCRKIFVALTKSDLNSYSSAHISKVSEALSLSSDQEIYLTSAKSNVGIEKMFRSLIAHRFSSNLTENPD